MSDQLKALRDALDIAEDLAAAQLADARQAYAGWPQKIAPAEHEQAQVIAGRSAMDLLLAEVEALRAANRDCMLHYDDARAEMEALRKDAARYRWLREHADVTFDEPVWIMTDGGRRIHVSTFARHETDRAIDAALRAKEESRG